MKLQPHTLPPEKAQKELRQFAVIGFVLSLVGLLLFWFLGIVGVAFGVRALLLAGHPELKNSKTTVQPRVMAIVAIAFGLIDVFAGLRMM